MVRTLQLSWVDRYCYTVPVAVPLILAYIIKFSVVSHYQTQGDTHGALSVP